MVSSIHYYASPLIAAHCHRYLSGLLRSAWGRGGRAALREVSAAGGGAWPLLESWEASSGADADGLVSYQLGVIYLEERCGLIVLGGRAFARERESRTLRELSVEELHGLHC